MMEINKIYNENCLETMSKMPNEFIDLVVTSPPQDGMREYNGYSFPFENIAKELYRVVKQGGVIVWIVGDATVNGLGQPRKPTHELYKQVAEQAIAIEHKEKELGIENKKDYYSYWLNLPTGGSEQGGNFEKYLIDRDGYIVKHFQCTVLNYDSEKGVKEAAEREGKKIDVGPGRSLKIFEEEYAVICNLIEEMIAGKKSIINPNA